MLTADLVVARRKGRELHLLPLDDDARQRAIAIAAALIPSAALMVGRTRDELAAAIGAVGVAPRDHRLRDGLVKLLEDRCTFDASDAVDPPGLRREVFAAASAARAALEPGEAFDRQAVLSEIARSRGTHVDDVERGLFADLRGSHVLRSFDAPSPASLVAAYESAQAQAVLLRAVRVTVHLCDAGPEALRALFRRLKFLRLLHAIAPAEGGVQIAIDGPFSLFESVTKYGLQLALLLPVLEACGAFRLEAEVRWGRERTPLVFRLAGAPHVGTDIASGAPLRDEVKAFAERFAALGTDWNVRENNDILQLPGIGLCVPDLVFERRRGRGRERVYLEVMGYWSRAAVWKRLELVEAGLGERILFAVSARLRVSEDIISESAPAALYVYKQTMNPRAVAERLDCVAARRLGKEPRAI